MKALPLAVFAPKLHTMQLTELLSKNRSYRRFVQQDRIPLALLEEWVGHCRLCASGRNLQALKYAIVYQEEDCAKVFPFLAWAGYLKDWPGPEEGERPSAYLIQLLDQSLATDCLCDDGIQLQTLLLSACEQGYGGCIIKAFNNKELRKLLNLPGHLQILHVLALGRPKEKVVIEDMQGQEVRYWRSPDQIHHVPKRPVSELVYRIGLPEPSSPEK